MKNCLLAFVILGTLLITGCSKEDKNSPVTYSYSINLYNATNLNIDCATRQLIKIKMVPADGSPNTKEANFVLNPGQSGVYKIDLASLGSYTISMFTNEGNSITWNNVAVSDGATVHATVGANSGDYMVDSKLASLAATSSTIPCN